MSLQKSIRTTISKLNFLSRSKPQSAYYASCSVLPLKIFIEVCNTGKVDLLCYKGNPDKEQLQYIWGDLLIEYGKVSGNGNIEHRIDLQKDIWHLKNAYTVIDAMIGFLNVMMILEKRVPKDETSIGYIYDLRKLGYKIDTATKERFEISLYAAKKKLGAIATQIAMKTNQIQGEKAEKNITFDSLIAMVSAELNMVIPEDITVLRYCEYKKIINRRIKAEWHSKAK